MITHIPITILFVFPMPGTAKKNLFDNQELSTLILISFILVKFTFDSRMIL